MRDALDRRPFIKAGDFIAWSIEWQSAETDSPGQALMDAFSLLDAVLLNEGNSLTFRRAVTGSIVDLTFVSNCLVRRGIEWSVSEKYTHSDHQAILINLSL